MPRTIFFYHFGPISVTPGVAGQSYGPYLGRYSKGLRNPSLVFIRRVSLIVVVLICFVMYG